MRLVLAGLLCLAPGLVGAEETFDALMVRLFKDNARTLALSDGRLVGPGAKYLVEATTDTQFVALGEVHNNHDIPPFTTALFSLLQAQHGFEYLATEQDPLMMATISREPVRGNFDAVAQLARRYLYGFTFITDEELRMLADIGAQSRGRHDPVWGAEQAFGITHYLDELITLAPDASAKAAAMALRERSGRAEAERKNDSPHFLSRDRDKRADLLALREAFAPREGSRSADLFETVLVSDEIYSYYTRAEQGEVVGLWNNWVREEWIKRRFIEEYRLAEARDRRAPKVLLKYGSWHIQRGRGPGNAFTLGNFVHDLALFNGQQAYSLQLAPYKERESLRQYPAGLAPFADLLPAQGWTLLDLRPFRPYVHTRKVRDAMPPDAYAKFSALVFGFDAVVFFADSDAAHFSVSGAYQ